MPDYKFFCFGGSCKFYKVDFDRSIEHHANYYDRDSNLLPFGEKDFPPVFKRKVNIPKVLPLMINLAERISNGIPFARIDMYERNERIYFGEVTFFPASGMGLLTPQSYDFEIGKLLRLPKQ